jgi:SAM-dependent methyltransferase
MTALLRTWPWPALLAWLSAWVIREGVVAFAAWPSALGVLVGLVPVFWVASRQASRWRAGIVLLGWPLMATFAGWWSLHASSASPVSMPLADMPWWVWLLVIALIWLIYPTSAWRDAPWYPTRRQALHDLPDLPGLPREPYILDVGSGLGHGLQALRLRFPDAQLTGIERSALLAVLSRLRLRTFGAAQSRAVASIVCGDMWAISWAEFDAVYLFQRPETMPRAWQKAGAEMRPGAWLISLAFEVPGKTADITFQGPGQRPVWAYRLTGKRSR